MTFNQALFDLYNKHILGMFISLRLFGLLFYLKMCLFNLLLLANWDP